MKKYLLLGFVFICSIISHGDEIGNGQWSTSSKLLKITSYWSFTGFKLDTSDGCGAFGTGWWRLDTSSSNTTYDRALDYKKSMLLAAYMAGENVKLRCENGAISDFSIGD